MRNIAVIDETFDSSSTPSYHLSLQYCDRSFSFAILDTDKLKYLAFKNFWFDAPTTGQNQTDQIRTLLNSENYLTLPYKSVHFLYPSPVSVLIPAPLFRKEEPEVYFKFSSELKPGDKVIFRKIPSVDSYALFPVPADFINQVGLMMQKAEFFHQSCPQIEEAISETPGMTGVARVYAHINSGFIDLLIISSEKLLFYNSFVIKNTDDLVFFILYLYEQFGLSQEESPVIIDGFPELYPGTTELLHQYLKQIVIRKFSKNYTYSQSFSDIVQHHNTQLLNLARCV